MNWLLVTSLVTAGTQAPADPNADRLQSLSGVWLVEQPVAPGAQPDVELMTLTMYDGVLSGTFEGDWDAVVITKVTLEDDVAHFQLNDENSSDTFSVKVAGDRMTSIPQTSADQPFALRRLSLAEANGIRARLAASRIKPKMPVLVDLPANGLAGTPPMGWNSWNTFALKNDNTTVRQTADAIVASGLRDAGYRYVIIDDGWEGERDSSGVLHPNAKFPDMKSLIDYVHSRGLKFGIYSSPGPKTCGGFAGSFGHEKQDAQLYASWGVDYLKYDFCSGGQIYRTQPEMRAAYQIMAQALRSTGRPIVFALCQYGEFNVGEWARNVGGNLWRTTGDIADTWDSMIKNANGNGDRRDAGPGHWNDPDMLEIGNGGMTDEEDRTHMSLWAMFAAPLLLGNDVRAMSEATKATLLNRRVIAVDQDPLGVQARLVAKEASVWTWMRPLVGHRVAIALVNLAPVPVTSSLDLSRLRIRATQQGTDVWNARTVSQSDLRQIQLPAHGSALYVFTSTLK
jgi:alpha-galactosidase